MRIDSAVKCKMRKKEVNPHYFIDSLTAQALYWLHYEPLKHG